MASISDGSYSEILLRSDSFPLDGEASMATIETGKQARCVTTVFDSDNVQQW